MSKEEKTEATEEGTRLQQLAKALATGNRHEAMRVCRKVLANPPSRLVEAKRRVWEIWQQELTNPDPEHSDRQLLNMMLDGKLAGQLAQVINKGYLEERDEVAPAYYKAMLNLLLIQLFERFRTGEAIPKRISKEKGRQLAQEKGLTA